MARIAGVDLKNIAAVYSLTEIYGIGVTQAKKILKMVKVSSETRMNDISDSVVAQIKQIIEENYKVEGELRQDVNRNIRRLKEIKSYRGDRHKRNLPTKGQGTRTNARQRKGKSMAVGGLKRVLTKT
jgi:small subunit ribosomal protein S13